MSTGDVVPQWPADRLPPRDAQLRKARRSLFGPVDHRESERFVRDELHEQYRLDRDKWNFDFCRERPLVAGQAEAARYEWEPVQRPAKGRAPDDDDINGGGKDPGRRQKHITDFMRKRKHPSGQKSPNATVKCPRRSST